MGPPKGPPKVCTQEGTKCANTEKHTEKKQGRGTRQPLEKEEDGGDQATLLELTPESLGLDYASGLPTHAPGRDPVRRLHGNAPSPTPETRTSWAVKLTRLGYAPTPVPHRT